VSGRPNAPRPVQPALGRTDRSDALGRADRSDALGRADRSEAPLLPPARAARLLDDVIFARVAELIDLPRLYDLEALLALQLESLGVEGEGARATAKAMVDRALARIARTSRRWTRRAPPRTAANAGGTADADADADADDDDGDVCEICGGLRDPAEQNAAP